METLLEKCDRLNQMLLVMDSVAVGFSGGVDSTFLAAAAHKVLGEKAVAVTCSSGMLPDNERLEAMELVRQIGIKHVFLQHNELEQEEFVRNDSLRCYYCKKSRFEALTAWATKQGFRWALDGSNVDDKADYRPGMRAVEEMDQVRSPLLEIGFTKAEIRDISRQWDLPTWNKPSAACLASRVAYGQPITLEKLAQIEQAELIVKEYCHGQVRIRHHGNLARIEVDSTEIGRITDREVGPMIAGKLRELGFAFVTVDLCGYQTGSMNRVLGEMAK